MGLTSPTCRSQDSNGNSTPRAKRGGCKCFACGVLVKEASPSKEGNDCFYVNGSSKVCQLKIMEPGTLICNSCREDRAIENLDPSEPIRWECFLCCEVPANVRNEFDNLHSDLGALKFYRSPGLDGIYAHVECMRFANPAAQKRQQLCETTSNQLGTPDVLEHHEYVMHEIASLNSLRAPPRCHRCQEISPSIVCYQVEHSMDAGAFNEYSSPSSLPMVIQHEQSQSQKKRRRHRKKSGLDFIRKKKRKVQRTPVISPTGSDGMPEGIRVSSNDTRRYFHLPCARLMTNGEFVKVGSVHDEWNFYCCGREEVPDSQSEDELLPFTCMWETEVQEKHAEVMLTGDEALEEAQSRDSAYVNGSKQIQATQTSEVQIEETNGSNLSQGSGHASVAGSATQSIGGSQPKLANNATSGSHEDNVADAQPIFAGTESTSPASCHPDLGSGLTEKEPDHFDDMVIDKFESNDATPDLINQPVQHYDLEKEKNPEKKQIPQHANNKNGSLLLSPSLSQKHVHVNQETFASPTPNSKRVEINASTASKIQKRRNTIDSTAGYTQASSSQQTPTPGQRSPNRRSSSEDRPTAVSLMGTVNSPSQVVGLYRGDISQQRGLTPSQQHCAHHPRPENQYEWFKPERLEMIDQTLRCPMDDILLDTKRAQILYAWDIIHTLVHARPQRPVLVGSKWRNEEDLVKLLTWFHEAFFENQFYNAIKQDIDQHSKQVRDRVDQMKSWREN